MSVWDLQQIARVATTKVQEVVLKESLYLGVPKFEEIGIRRMSERLKVELRVHAVEVHLEDLKVRKTVEDYLRWEAVRYVLRWAPSTREAELRGGPLDMIHVCLEEPVDVWALAGAIGRGNPSYALNYQVPSPDDAEESSRGVEYRIAGWHEEGRRWVYDYHLPKKPGTKKARENERQADE